MTRGIYKSYHWTEHDPILDVVDRVIELSGMSYAQIERRSGVTPTTLRKWHSRQTKRPQYSTVAAVIRCTGGTMSVELDGQTITITRRRKGY
jgi:transcriptional regulator with XRE-family HTH domain